MPYRTRSKTTCSVTDHHVFTDWIERLDVAMDSEGDCYGSVMVFLLKTTESSTDYFFYNFSTFHVVYSHHELVMTPVQYFSVPIMN